MRSFVAGAGIVVALVLSAIAIVLSAQGGNLQSQAVPSVTPADAGSTLGACRDVGRFYSAVEMLAKKVSTTGDFFFSVTWRVTPEGIIRYHAAVGIYDLRPQYYDFHKLAYVYPSGADREGTFWGTYYKAVVINTDIREPGKSLTDVLCETARDLEERFGLRELPAKENFGVQTFFEESEDTSYDFLKKRSISANFSINRLARYAQKLRYRASFSVLLYQNENDPISYIKSIGSGKKNDRFSASEFGRTPGEALVEVVFEFVKTYPRVGWGS